MKALLTIVALLALTACAGPSGVQGVAGAPGQNCSELAIGASSIAPNGGVQLTCPNQSPLLILNGTNGTNGTNGFTFASVQFCTQVTNYPSTFPEVGFCINGSLYAVYSANGGYLFQVANGAYSSNAIGSACNFSVSGCSVTN